jgi:hypothetical protein
MGRSPSVETLGYFQKIRGRSDLRFTYASSTFAHVQFPFVFDHAHAPALAPRERARAGASLKTETKQQT